jgi:hypothetical protein
MRQISVDTNLIARCGLYCGACGRYLKEACPGCAENEKASWCSVRSCCGERGQGSCADCADFSDARECGKFNNPVARVFGFIFRSDRAACVRFIRERGRDAFAREMAARGTSSIRRGQRA